MKLKLPYPTIIPIIDSEKINLNLGCGRRNLSGKWINVDKFKHDNVDVIHDLDTFPYPFADNSIDYIFMNEVIEHLAKPYEALLECHRILKPGGMIEITTSHKNNLSAYDIAHKSYFTERSMCHLIDVGKDTGTRVHKENETAGSSLQCRSYFKEIFTKVYRFIPTPWGYIRGFNIYHSAIGIGIRCRLHWKLMKI